jgi:predicted DNA-binding transcriptional regulator AlpA
MKSISGNIAMEGDRKGPRLEPLLTAKNVADLLHLSRSSIARLVDLEGLPAFVVFRHPRKRILRFREQEVEQWLAGRRERQVTATLNGARYTRHQRSES